MLNAPATTSVPRQTIWGLDPVQLHAHYWASYGVQVVRLGEPSQIIKHAELYLLTDPNRLPMFSLGPVVRTMEWLEPHLLTLRMRDTRQKVYREHAISDGADKFLKFERHYEMSGRRTRVMLTTEREIAELWMASPDPIIGYRRIKRFVPRHERINLKIEGKRFDRTSDREMVQFVDELVSDWKRPGATITRARQRDGNGVWVDPDARVDPASRLIGSVWVGAGRQVEKDQVIVGPKIIWDDPTARPETKNIDWMMIEPSHPPRDVKVTNTPTSFYLSIKRLFDICLAIIGIILSLPLFPIICFAIWIEDGFPLFFGHGRMSGEGKRFTCWKFRSMRNGADKMRDVIAKLNQVDGPQVYIEDDPRITRVGKFLRKYNLDEIPQFWNVLTGSMSMVGPRPSPHTENQFCPPWREARLSVRPGITGLWQIRRTRNKGSDFQEWIKYDIEYVENMSFWLDLKIIYKTVEQVVRKGTRS